MKKKKKMRTRGGVSKRAWSSRMRLLEPFTRNVPSISVAEAEPSDASAILYVMQHQTEQPAHRSPSKTNHCNDIGPGRQTKG
jgi:hypothetical protein